MHLTTVHIIFVMLAVIFVIGVGVYSGTRVKSAEDFAGGGRASAPLVAGIIMGTLVGGSSTVGTAQLAFQFGISAWWFTLGAGIGCLVLGLFLAKPLRESGKETIPQFLVETYGPNSGPITTVFSSIGIFLNVVAQILAADALLTSMFGLSPITGSIIAIILVVLYVFFGGNAGSGMTGVAKLVLLYLSLIVVGVLAYSMAGGAAGITSHFPAFPTFSLFGRGFAVDFAAGFSLVVGVISTQTYFGALFAGKDAATARRGALISAILIPPTGIAGILVGLYMKMNFPKMNAAEALPTFVINYLPPWFSGIVLGTLLIAVVGTGAGLVLGISTMLTKDVYKRFISPQASDRTILFVSRGLLVVVAAINLLFVTGNLKSLILQWSFLSMGLRGCTVCMPLLGAIFFKNKVSYKAGLIALVIGPASCLLWKLLNPKGMDPLYAGLLASIICLVIGSLIFPAKKTPLLEKGLKG
ncbi:sodium:solute symporter family protein [Desulfosporosinus sp. PR]|uniref:sodium:solute symporter family protein n=1 Tax=Candidatus Desulfosporosinus nitrosoreducens TaxID=3401928 RepID=UPI0027F957B7|nr:sodium:solute symporter family protein [Desulfosporosinus sp. PR]MDQ7096825.1 sodium:solute symporter family protein [Desulfosporosinus sp. PR]